MSIELLAAVASILWAIVVFFLKRTMTTVDTHDTKIQHIEKTYVEKKELEQVRTELRDEIKKLASDIEDIKENCLRKDDFIREVTILQNSLREMQKYLMERGGRNA